MGLARGDLHGKKEVHVANLCTLKVNVFSDLMTLYYSCSDYYHIKRQIETELIQSGDATSSKPFLDLSKSEHLLKLKDRLKKYCQKVQFLKL
jgi:hypothetical protein